MTTWTIGIDRLEINLTPILSLSLTLILSLRLGLSFGFALIFYYRYRCIYRFMVVAMGGYYGGGGDRFTVGLRRWLGFVLVGGGSAFRFWFWVLFGCLVIFSLGVW